MNRAKVIGKDMDKSLGWFYYFTLFKKSDGCSTFSFVNNAILMICVFMNHISNSQGVLWRESSTMTDNWALLLLGRESVINWEDAGIANCGSILRCNTLPSHTIHRLHEQALSAMFRKPKRTEIDCLLFLSRLPYKLLFGVWLYAHYHFWTPEPRMPSLAHLEESATSSPTQCTGHRLCEVEEGMKKCDVLIVFFFWIWTNVNLWRYVTTNIEYFLPVFL